MLGSDKNSSNIDTLEKSRGLIEHHRLIRNALLNVLGYMLPMLAAVIAIPFLVNGMGKDRFGALTLAWVLFGYLGLFDLGLSRALTKLVAEKLGDGKEDQIPGLIWTATFMMFALGLIVGFGLCVGANIFLSYINVPDFLKEEFTKSLYAIGLIMPFVIVSIGFRGVLDAYQRFDISNMIRVPLGVYVFCAPLLVLPFSNSLLPTVIVIGLGRIAAGAVYFLFCIRVVPALSKKIVFQWDKVRYLLGFGGWMTITNIINPLLVHVDRFLIGAFFSLSYLTYYATPSEIVTKILMLPGALMGVMFPAFSTSYSLDKSVTRSLYETWMKYICLIMFPISGGLIIFASVGFSVWLGSDFAHYSAPVLQWMAIGLFLLSVGQVPYALIQSIGRPDITAKLHLIELPTYVFLASLLIANYGLLGAAYAWVIRIGIDTSLLLFFSNRLLSLRFTGLWLIYGLAFFLIVILVSMAFIESLMFKINIAVALAILYTFVSWKFFLEPREKASFKNMFPI